MSIHQKLLKVQLKLKAPKGQYNKFGKFNYRSAEDILEAVKPLNAEQGLLLTLTDEPIFIGDWHYIKATATITDGESSHTVTAYARESEHKKGMDHSQITGTASSYARKYALNGLYLIDDTKDADTDQYQEQNRVQQNNQGKPEKQVSRSILLAKWKTGGGTEEQFNEWFAKQSSQGHTNNEMDRFLTKELMKRGKGDADA